MSLGVVIKGPEGVVLAADSRVTLQAQRANEPPVAVNFDNATKLLGFSDPHDYVGAVTYGMAVIGLRTAHSFVPEFERELPAERMPVEEFAKLMSAFYLKRWEAQMPEDFPGPGMTFIVAGYNEDQAYGSVYVFDIPKSPVPEVRNPGASFGMTWGGQLEIASRLVHGYDPQLPEIVAKRLKLGRDQLDPLMKEIQSQLHFRIPYDVLPLQDCVDLATFLVRTTISLQGFGVGVRGVGGPIDVAVIRRTRPLRHVQRKQIRGESGRELNDEESN